MAHCRRPQWEMRRARRKHGCRYDPVSVSLPRMRASWHLACFVLFLVSKHPSNSTKPSPVSRSSPPLFRVALPSPHIFASLHHSLDGPMPLWTEFVFPSSGGILAAPSVANTTSYFAHAFVRVEHHLLADMLSRVPGKHASTDAKFRLAKRTALAD